MDQFYKAALVLVGEGRLVERVESACAPIAPYLMGFWELRDEVFQEKLDAIQLPVEVEDPDRPLPDSDNVSFKATVENTTAEELDGFAEFGGRGGRDIPGRCNSANC